MNLSNGMLKKATGDNTNPFFQTEIIPAPIVSAKATGTGPELKQTVVYDLPTQAGEVYTLVN